MSERQIIDKLSKLHALHFGAQTEGERISAIRAKARILKNINNNIEYKFTLQHEINADIFISLLNNYDIHEYRTPKQKNTTIIAKVPGVFVDNILWPEYLATPNRVRI